MPVFPSWPNGPSSARPRRVGARRTSRVSSMYSLHCDLCKCRNSGGNSSYSSKKGSTRRITQNVNNSKTAGAAQQKNGTHHNKEHPMDLRAATTYNEWPPTKSEWKMEPQGESRIRVIAAERPVELFIQESRSIVEPSLKIVEPLRQLRSGVFLCRQFPRSIAQRGLAYPTRDLREGC